MDDLLGDIRARAVATPWMPAVRVGGDMVTYGALDMAIESYGAVLDKYEMSRESAFYAAIMHTVPALSAVDNPNQQGLVVNQVVEWVGRHLPPPTGGLRVAG
ncbi:hypothetical protein [Gordonia aichiensis]|uniref:Uncharacterized protein n=1 Tax=Gordonia aichiensis NBRC 108223 TaxID=1220583 RepID=L7KHT7_9ACTN|nr:hypothetical protein [Gordonia aichiensis]GAC47283.1 hypothetical protein GOACH_03_03010 [Gordonia aichiensis NBRC 108223]